MPKFNKNVVIAAITYNSGRTIKIPFHKFEFTRNGGSIERAEWDALDEYELDGHIIRANTPSLVNVDAIESIYTVRVFYSGEDVPLEYLEMQFL